MTSLEGLLPHPGSTNWRKNRTLTTDSQEDSIVVRHVVIREVWLEKKPWPHAVYKVDVMSQTSHWFVFKRFKEFYQLHQKLVKMYNIPKDLLPPRKITNNMARENLERRRESLEHYLQKLLNSCNGAIRQSEELADFLDVKSHDVPHVAHHLASYLKENGQSILMSKEIFQLSPSQLYCITKQKQLPHPSGRHSVDLANLYEFVGALKKLSITDYISQQSNGEQFEVAFTFDLGMFNSLRELQLDAINVESVRGISSLRTRLLKLTARYCLQSMKQLLIDASVEKRTAPQVSLSAESWRVQAAIRLADNRMVLQPWHVLTYINFSHNNIASFDNSMGILPSLKQLDLSHNKIIHLDLQLLIAPNLKTLNLSSNSICLISGSSKSLDNLKSLNVSHNKIHSMEGLLCCRCLEELNLSYNKIAVITEVKKLASLTKLNNLMVEGNHFTRKKRHRIIIFAYFRERPFLLDKRSITEKEQNKLDAKFAALERFEDMDDSISSISTVSDDSDLDSGYDNSNWISKLASLSKIQETDYEVIPKITWDELYAVDNETSCTSSISSGVSQENLNEEVLSREDWERILSKQKVDISLGKKLIENISENSTDTLKENTKNKYDSKECWRNTGAIPKRLERARSHESPIKSPNLKKININENSGGKKHLRSASLSHHKESKDRSKTWLANLFVGKNYTKSQKSSLKNVETGQVLNSESNPPQGNLIVIPEIEEMKIDERLVSKSFDDNCDFEKAEECEEEMSKQGAVIEIESGTTLSEGNVSESSLPASVESAAENINNNHRTCAGAEDSVSRECVNVSRECVEVTDQFMSREFTDRTDDTVSHNDQDSDTQVKCEESNKDEVAFDVDTEVSVNERDETIPALVERQTSDEILLLSSEHQFEGNVTLAFNLDPSYKNDSTFT